MEGFGALLFALAIIGFIIYSQWVVFEKAGQPGWAAIIPIYNFWVLTKITRLPGWLVILCCIPYVNIIPISIIYYQLGKSFGQSTGFCIGLILLGFIFIPLMAFDKSIQYQYKDDNVIDQIGR